MTVDFYWEDLFMKSIKHIITLCLSLAMIFSFVVASGVTTASAVAGAGIQ